MSCSACENNYFYPRPYPSWYFWAAIIKVSLRFLKFWTKIFQLAKRGAPAERAAVLSLKSHCKNQQWLLVCFYPVVSGAKFGLWTSVWQSLKMGINLLLIPQFGVAEGHSRSSANWVVGILIAGCFSLHASPKLWTLSCPWCIHWSVWVLDRKHLDVGKKRSYECD